MNISYHGAVRMAERTTIKEKNAVEKLNNIFLTGKKWCDYEKNKVLQDWLKKTAAKRNRNVETFRIKGNQVYIFSDDNEFVTVIDIPQPIMQGRHRVCDNYNRAKNKREWMEGC